MTKINEWVEVKGPGAVAIVLAVCALISFFASEWTAGTYALCGAVGWNNFAGARKR
jgi:hypothetical protein